LLVALINVLATTLSISCVATRTGSADSTTWLVGAGGDTVAASIVHLALINVRALIILHSEASLAGTTFKRTFGVDALGVATVPVVLIALVDVKTTFESTPFVTFRAISALEGALGVLAGSESVTAAAGVTTLIDVLARPKTVLAGRAVVSSFAGTATIAPIKVGATGCATATVISCAFVYVCAGDVIAAFRCALEIPLVSTATIVLTAAQAQGTA